LKIAMKENPSFIEKKYVWSFAIRFSVTALFLFLIFDLILWFALNRHLGEGYLTDIAVLNDLQEHLPIIFLISGGLQAVVASFVILAVSLSWAHAVAGPVVRFRRYLRMIIENQPIEEEMVFRQKDQLHDLAEGFRGMQNKRKERWDQLTLYCAQADQLIEAYEQKQEVEIREALIKIYEKIKELFDERGNC